MKTSVITVVYNRANLILNAVESVANQSYSDVEHVIIDGASTDGTLQKIKNHKLKIKPILISEPDQGIYDAINKGIKIATGDIICLLHSDDVFASNTVIETVVAEFGQFTELDAIYGDIAYMKLKSPKNIARYYSSKNFNKYFLKYGVAPAHPSLFLRKTAIKKIGLYDHSFNIAGDFEYFCRLLYNNTLKIQYLNILTTKMSSGGSSRPSIKTLIKVSSEILRACQKNGVRSNWIYIHFRYFIKLAQFLNKRA